MKVFISSLISGMEPERAAAKRAVELFRHKAVMAEDFGAKPSSPQVACLAGVREADLFVLVLGARYGAAQASGLSATHEEYGEARGRKPILVFLQDGHPEPAQAAFIAEISGWEKGLYRAAFTTADDLNDRISQALHDYELANATAPLDADALVRQAASLLPEAGRNQGGASLHLVVATGPRSAILRPAEIEAADLSDALEQQALFGRPPIFDRKIGTVARQEEHALVLSQEPRLKGNAEIRLWGTGDLRLLLPIDKPEQGGVPMLIEEDLAEKLAASLSYAAWALSRIDPTEKLTHVALAARVAGKDLMDWRTRAEHAASPSSGSFGMFQEQRREEHVMLEPAHMVRAALTMNAAKIAEDLLVLLRRRWKDPGISRW